ncbi:MAG: hypothetical protein R6X25_02845 [Candidatus Krumholzibacteriia bacterium]
MMQRDDPRSTFAMAALAVTLVVAIAPSAAVGAADAARTEPRAGVNADSLALRAGSQETDFRSFTVEAENRIQFEFERPALTVDLDPRTAPGLTWGSPRDVLDRTVPDLEAPLLTASVVGRSPYLPRPWDDGLRSGPVARFRPSARGLERWELTVVDSRSKVVRVFAGRGNPPEEIVWDGLDIDGDPVSPGLTFSYVFEALDRAGNKKRFVGEGFTVPSFRLEHDGAPVIVLAGSDLATPGAGSGAAPAGRRGADDTPPLVLETASWLNRRTGPERPVLITATARTARQAEEIGERFRTLLLRSIPGPPARVAVRVQVVEAAPSAGSVVVTCP